MTVPYQLCFHFFLIAATLSVVLCKHTYTLQYLNPHTLQTKTNASTQEQAALKIIHKYYTNVTVEVNPCLLRTYNKDAFILSTNKKHLHIEASSGVAAVWGFHYFLKKSCHSYIGWQTRNVRIPALLPALRQRVVAAGRFRYYQSPVTASFSFVWWNVSQWVEHVEWMALNGINAAPAPIDQERIWAKIYKSLGMTDREVDRHFTGPAFLAWLRLGALSGWRGGLPASWHRRAAAVRRAVLPLMYRLGMAPVLPAFNGHVPRAFRRIFPNATFYQVSRWRDFPDEYCCGLFLNGSDPLFTHVGHKFLAAVTELADKSNLYSADPFYQVSVGAMTPDIIRNAGKAIFASMLEVDARAVWVLQCGMLAAQPTNWPVASVHALLRAAPIGRLLALDELAELRPLHARSRRLHGQPYLWCLMQNYGGQLDMIGNLHTISEAPIYAANESSGQMIGIGITPEGINQNYVVYDLMLEMGWRKSPVDIFRWIKSYALRRYGCGSLTSAWLYLLTSVYNYNDQDREYYFYYHYTYNTAPSLNYPKAAWYAGRNLFEALLIFVNASANCHSEGYYHDLVDVARQALQYRAEQIFHHGLRTRAVARSNVTALRAATVRFLTALQDLEGLLASHPHFSLAGWLSAARCLATSPRELRHYENNALTQITLFGPNGELSDYAAKQWAEMFRYYYIPRWKLFLDAVQVSKKTNTKFNEEKVQYDIRENFEKRFVETKIKPLHKMDTLSLAVYLCYKWGNIDLPDLPNKFQVRK